MAKKEKPEEEDDMPTAPAWMATFSDMMTLLMCFFILIMSFSTMEDQKFKLAMGSLKGAFGVIGTQKKLAPEQNWFSPSTFSAYSIKESRALQQMEKMGSILEKNGLGDKVSLNMTNGEVFVEIKDSMLFAPGSATLRSNFVKLLSIIAKLFFVDASSIMIEGHTDDIPINTKEFPSNWELSTARSLSVLRYFIEVDKIDPAKMAAVGYGQYKPKVRNDTPANRAKNRRVVIRMKI